MATPRTMTPALLLRDAWSSHYENALRPDAVRSVEMRIGLHKGRRLVVARWSDQEVQVYHGGVLVSNTSPNQATVARLRFARFHPWGPDYKDLTRVERLRVVENVLVGMDRFGNHYIVDAAPHTIIFPNPVSFTRTGCTEAYPAR